MPNQQNLWKRQPKHQNNQGNSLLKFYQGNPKDQGRTGERCRTAGKQPKKVPSGSRLRVGKTAGQNSRKNSPNSCFGCLGCFSGCFSAVSLALCPGPTQIFRLSGIQHLSRWPQRLQYYGHSTFGNFFKGGGTLTRGNDIRVTPGMTVRWRSAPCAPPRYCHAIAAQILVVP